MDKDPSGEIEQRYEEQKAKVEALSEPIVLGPKPFSLPRVVKAIIGLLMTGLLALSLGFGFYMVKSVQAANKRVEQQIMVSNQFKQSTECIISVQASLTPLISDLYTVQGTLNLNDIIAKIYALNAASKQVPARIESCRAPNDQPR